MAAMVLALVMGERIFRGGGTGRLHKQEVNNDSRWEKESTVDSGWRRTISLLSLG